MPGPLVMTMGDPTGVGPELIVKALLAGDFDDLSRPLLVAGDPGCLLRAGRLFGASGSLGGEARDPVRTVTFGRRSLPVRALSGLEAEGLVYGRPDAACGRAMFDYIAWAGDECRAGRAAGMVTAPVNKAAMHDAGCTFPGHTELLADRCGVEKVVMMLAGARLRVCLVTTHLALAAVPGSLSQAQILATIRVAARDLRRFFGLEAPRLAVLALNPHAGEEGLFGDEEERLIRPAIVDARREGLAVTGPHSADTLFHFAVTEQSWDAVVCMYHDQALIPLKLLHFEDAVNVTLGLPIVRTSVDHGTAYDLAGSGRASTRSLVAAVRMAERMTRHAGAG